MGSFLNFGAGPNQLPEPWQNLNAEHDIRKRLKFDDGSAARILAEHVIEHAPFLQGFGFLQECFRLLEPGGVLRLSFPDVSKFVTPPRYSGLRKLNVQSWNYAEALRRSHHGQLLKHARGDVEKVRASLLLLLVGWQHQAMWTSDGAAAVLIAIGFSAVQECQYGRGDVAGVDGHHRDVGDEVAVLETSILEAKK